MSNLSPWKSHNNRARKTACLVGGAVGIAAALSVRLGVGGTLEVLHRLDAPAVLPPLWLLTLLYLGGFFLAGAAAGSILYALWGGLGCAREAAAWRGCTCLTLSVTLTLCWYALFFGRASLLVSWLCLLLAVALALASVLAWWIIDRLASLAVCGYTAVCFVLVVCQVAVLLHR